MWIIAFMLLPGTSSAYPYTSLPLKGKLATLVVNSPPSGCSRIPVVPSTCTRLPDDRLGPRDQRLPGRLDFGQSRPCHPAVPPTLFGLRFGRAGAELRLVDSSKHEYLGPFPQRNREVDAPWLAEFNPSDVIFADENVAIGLF